MDDASITSYGSFIEDDVVPLPEDWSPVMADRVDIPVSKAIVLEGNRKRLLS